MIDSGELFLCCVGKPYVANSFSQSEYSARESDGRVAVTIVASRYYFYGSFSVKIKSSVNTKLTPYGMVIVLVYT